MDSKKHSRKEKKHRRHRRESRSRSRSRSESSNEQEKRHKDRNDKTTAAKGGGEEKSLSIEETNKLRAMLGLKPLQAPGPSVGGASTSTAPAAKSTATTEVFVQTRNTGEDKETERIREKLDLAKERRRVTANITAKPLGEDNSADDISSWVQRSRELELAKQREKLLSEADEQVTSTVPEPEKPRYSSHDLAGLRVEHSLDRIKDERAIILTLKDRPVLAEESEEGNDILENVNIADEERAEHNKANKKAAEQVSGYGVVRYRPYDDEEGTEGTSLLNKYDEEIYGRKKQFFVLSGSSQYDEEGTPTTERKVSQKLEQVGEPRASASSNGTSVAQPKMEVDTDPLEELRAKLRNPVRPATTLSARPALLATTSLNSGGPSLASEYYTPEEMAAKFKKVRKVRKPIRTLKADDLIEIDKETTEAVNVPMEEDAKPSSSLVDAQKLEPVDAELEATLSRTKKLRDSSGNAKFSRRLPEHVAVDLLAQTTLNSSATTTILEDVDGPGWVMLNQTSEFCRGIGELPTIGDTEAPENGAAIEEKPASMEMGSDEERESLKKKPFVRNYRKAETSDDESSRRHKKTETSKKRSESVKKEPRESGGESDEESSEGEEFVLGYEPKAAGSTAEALRLAAMKGYLDKPKGQSGGGGTTVVGGKVSQLAARSFTVEERTHNDIDAKFSGGRARGPRGSGGPVVEFCEKDTYQPEVKLEYVDLTGKVVNQKEAFRLLSHRFHGKGSGKRKIEKRLRKEAQERKILQQSSSDTPLGTLNRLVQRQQKEKQAFVVLSSTGTAPSVSISMPTANESPAKRKAVKSKKPAPAGSGAGASTSVAP